MIGTEQERDALMAAVVEYGDQRQVFGFAAARNDGDRVGLATITADQIFAAIRAMLAPTDDAVVISRALAERAVEAFRLESVTLSATMDKMRRGQSSLADAKALLAVLRGEATRDE